MKLDEGDWYEVWVCSTGFSRVAGPAAKAGTTNEGPSAGLIALPRRARTPDAGKEKGWYLGGWWNT
jgi:hypothetical protein